MKDMKKAGEFLEGITELTEFFWRGRLGSF
jgi:hypothetical protein